MKIAEHRVKAMLTAYHIPSLAHYVVEDYSSLERLKNVAIDQASIRSENVELEVYAHTPEEVIEKTQHIAELHGFPILVIPHVEQERVWEVSLVAKKWACQISVQEVHRDEAIQPSSILLRYHRVWPFQLRQLTCHEPMYPILLGLLDLFYKERGVSLTVTLYAINGRIFVEKAALIVEEQQGVSTVFYRNEIGLIDVVANSRGLSYAVADRLADKRLSIRSLSMAREDCSDVIECCDALIASNPRVVYVHLFTALLDGTMMAEQVLQWSSIHNIHSVLFLQGTNSVQGCALFATAPYGFASTSIHDVLDHLHSLR